MGPARVPDGPSWDVGALSRMNAPTEAPPGAPAPPQRATAAEPVGPRRPWLPVWSDVAGPGLSRTRAPASAEVVDLAATRPRTRSAEQRRASRRPAVAGWRRSLTHLRSLVGSDETPHDLLAAATAVQQPVTTGRRVVVVGAHGGAGVTTVAVLVTRVLAALRSDQVVVAALLNDGGALGGRLGPTQVPNLRGVHVRGDGADRGAGAVENLSRAHAFTVLDLAGEVDHPAVGLAHAVVLVTSLDESGAPSVADVAGELRAAGADPRAVVVVAVDTGRGTATGTGATRTVLREGGATVVALPGDRHLAAGGAVTPALLAEPTYVAAHRVAAEVVRRAREA
ncbi:hypothetical protein [Luteipulveratus flavus]|uniref:CobQ/CobB/MinD/ParA nucleotide binding domain-containing protein n=1 Tax=Luteipulveratus flavus TaxID=3031728 RepID=A0ABT6C2N6_9MICO|nr:hypothetical protein [Luteipulveratus sp. YIM 133296]MDF8263018.1 hypothetical protein [Luteipulveratus sp. YIM 133296]